MTGARASELLFTMDAICRHQLDQTRHPLTCGNDSSHDVLVPIVEDEVVVLRCSGCDYRQTFIPEFFKRGGA